MNAKQYNTSNKPHFGFAQNLLQLTEKYDKKKKLDVIIDVGCGSGNITEYLSTQVVHGKIFGLDIDHNMIGFAKESQTIDSIEYVLTDLSGDWNSIDENIKQLESKVSMVFSNMSLGLIKDKAIFVRNLKKLMADNARTYLSFPFYPDINSKLKDEFKQKFGAFVEMPSFEGQMKVWTDLFEENGFTVEFQEIKHINWPHKGQEFQSIIRFFSTALDIYMINGIRFFELHDQIQRQLITLLVDQIVDSQPNSINWNILDQLKENSSDDITMVNYPIGYIVCKSVK